MSIKKIEPVLKRFTKRIHGFGNQSYDVRLKALNEHSLEWYGILEFNVPLDTV